MTGTNFIRDGLMNGNQDAYDLVNMGAYIAGGMALEAGQMYPKAPAKEDKKESLGACFVAGTLIKTPDGNKYIENIKVRDEVYAKNPKTGEWGWKRVVHLFRKETTEIVSIEVGNEIIRTTTSHPFWVVGYGFKPAGELCKGEFLETSTGKSILIEDIYKEHYDIPIIVYNFEVEDWHTYYVSKNEILVHNSCSKGGIGTPKTTRRQAFRQAKKSAGIPKSAQYTTHKFVYDGSTENRIVYEFDVNGQKKYIIEHPYDKFGRGTHFHGADALKGSPFNKGTYNQYDGHFPEDFDGF